MAALSETELDRLEQFLESPERAGHALPLDMAQGLLAAVASGPAPVAEERWLAEILGESPGFASDGERQEIAGLLARFAEQTARQLNEADGFDFILYGEDDDLAAWAEGYLMGVDLADPPWDTVADAEDLDNLLFPFLALTGDAKNLALESGEEWMSDADEARMLADIRDGFASHLFDVRQYFFGKSVPATVRRDAPKVGRNEPCPCGSGKKYKNCHGE